MSDDTIRIMMVDDDEEDFLITRDTISDINRGKYTLEWVPTYEKALEAFSQNHHDIYFIDYRLGTHTGLEVIEKAREMGVESPLVLLTGQNDPLIDEMALKAGAADYLVKGTITPSHLERVIRYSIRQAANVREIISLNVQLEKRVRERTKTLQDAMEELNRSRDELEAALEKEKDLNDLKSRFVAMASHEFRTPLATILSSLSLVGKYLEQEGVSSEKLEKHMMRIRSNISHMTELLNDVLSLSKLEEGKIIAIPDTVDLKAFTEEITKDVSGMLKPGQKIVYTHTGNSETFSVDKKILKNIMLNFLSNAIKFSQEEKEIFIHTDISSAVTISIRDQGIGISEEDQKHLFGRFFRGQNAVNIQGTGLGLSIVSKYVEVLKGNVKVDSALGEGTTFTVTLPAGE